MTRNKQRTCPCGKLSPEFGYCSNKCNKKYSNNQQPSVWEKEFDNNFEPHKHWQGDKWVTDKVKLFIKTILSTQKAEIKSLIMDMAVDGEIDELTAGKIINKIK